MSQRSAVGLMLRTMVLALVVLAAMSQASVWGQAPDNTSVAAKPAGVDETRIAAVARNDSDSKLSPADVKTGHGAKSGKFKHGDWPFTPPQRPQAPRVSDSSWVKNPVDSFILAKLEEKGLRPSGPADKRTLLRRITFDLTGLPPTFEEIGAFLVDDSPEAYANVVERLLASARYGERWAQHWLDVVRYAETDGFKQDAIRPNAYRYRDYVIRALNDDFPYDRFLQQQLAGDELEPNNPDAIIATGLNRLYPDEYNAANIKQRRQEILDEVTDVTGQALLGLTMGCAQCHDHKFDEILQTDYFRLQAFFTPMLPRDDVVVASAEEQREFAENLAVWEEATREIRTEIDSILKPHLEQSFKDTIEKYEQDIQAILLMTPEDRDAQQKQWAVQAEKLLVGKSEEALKKLKGDQKERYEALQKKLAEFDHLKPKPLPTAMAITDAGPQSPPTYRLATGNFTKPLEKVEPGFPSFLGASEPAVQPSPSTPESTGRRSALARWLTRADHPLTARVMMNRVWQHHFGAGIVGTGNDFGAMGDEPTHPELLDWLAVEFVERGWSLKAMHRLIVSSAAYQQSSFVDLDLPQHQQALEADPENDLLWHFRRQRLDGESIRDAMLSIAGQLNLKMYGESARPELPTGLKSTYAWKADEKPEDRNRRSIYVFARRNLRLPLLESFDLPDMHNSCPRRANTTTAPQALHLLNSEFALEQARRLAGRLLNDYCECEGEEARVRVVYELAFGRVPTSEEAAAAVAFVNRQMETVARHDGDVSPELRPIPEPEAGLEPAHAAAYVDLCHALLNSNEFLFVD
ncbi:MAG: DUF1549 and DUF1553 domain-containing protein [Pirellulales bacterium]